MPRGRLWRTICISFVLIFLADTSKYVITWLNGFGFWPDWLKMVLCLFKNKIAATCTDCKLILNSLPLRNSFLFSGKISAQPHTTLCIQFLNRENNDKNNTFPLGKQICFTIVWGCAETLPKKQCRYFLRQKENNLDLIYLAEVYETAVKC